MPVQERVVNVATIEVSAQDAYQEVQAMLIQAQTWVNEAEDEEQLATRREKFTEMSESFHRNIAHIIFTSQNHDGPVTLSRDGFGSFFWIHGKSGYHGGLIFHRSYGEDGDARIGTWSIHT